MVDVTREAAAHGRIDQKLIVDAEHVDLQAEAMQTQSITIINLRLDFDACSVSL